MQLRAVTWNIHKGIGGVDRAYRPDRTAAVLRHYAPDLVLLQEVDEGARRSGGHRQVDLLGDALGLRHRAFHANVAVRGGGHYGNAILSRWPLTRERNVVLTIPGSKRRSVLHVRLRVRSPRGRQVRTLHVYDFHLGLTERLRRAQLQLFLTSRPFLHLDPRTPILAGGDLNDVWGRVGPEYLAAHGFRSLPRVRTFPAVAPVFALDGLYVRGHASIRPLPTPPAPGLRWASDHRPLAALIEIG